jgi:hypothetical protein
MDTSCGVSVNLSQLPTSTTPLHIVLWKGVDTATPTVTSTSTPAPLNLETNETIKRLLDRITVLEGMVTGLVETQKSSIWFSQGLRPTPTGIEVVSRRESMGAESDIGTVLSQLVRPSDPNVRTVTIAPTIELPARAASGPEPEATPSDELEVEEEAVEEEVVEEEAVEEEVVEEEAVEEETVEEEEEATPRGLEEEEEIVEYKEIEWKGQTYYVDSNQQVYEMDSDGDLVETPIGVWKEATQKLVRYKAP